MGDLQITTLFSDLRICWSFKIFKTNFSAILYLRLSSDHVLNFCWIIVFHFNVTVSLWAVIMRQADSFLNPHYSETDLCQIIFVSNWVVVDTQQNMTKYKYRNDETLKSAFRWWAWLLSPKLRSSDLRAFQMSCTEIKTDTLAAIWER